MFKELMQKRLDLEAVERKPSGEEIDLELKKIPIKEKQKKE